MNESTRTSLPEPDSVSPVPESVSSETGEEPEVRQGSDAEADSGTEDPEAEGDATTGEEEAPDLSHLPAEYRDAVGRLHRKVEQAAATIERLRAENDRLRRRVEALEEKPDVPEGETVFALDDDPETVKQRISRFIDAIDTYLEAAASESPSNDPEDAADDPTDS